MSAEDLPTDFSRFNTYRRYRRPDFNRQSIISPGAVVDIEHEDGDCMRLFLGPEGGGVSYRGEQYHLATDKRLNAAWESPAG